MSWRRAAAVASRRFRRAKRLASRRLGPVLHAMRNKEFSAGAFAHQSRVWVLNNKFEAGLILGLLFVSALAHAVNMFGFPYIENDEATYTARAWSFITSGQLDVYTYRYDHAPLGWMLLGIWQMLAGGTHVFGSLIDSGRVFMFVLHLASTALVYVLGKRFSGGSKLAGAVAVLLFSLSPIALYFQRRILLDNIMTFWLLLSLFFATQPVQRLKYYLLSAVTFGIAVLTKLNVIFVAPAVLFVVWIRSHKGHRLHATFYWLAVTGIVIGLFFIYALLKGELFAAPIGPDGAPAHVSVVETFKLQLGRGDFAWPWELQSSFIQNVLSWALKDWTILALGAFSTLAILVVGIWRLKRQPYVIALAMIVLLYIAFLARGKIVLDLYIVPLIPFFALSIGVLASMMYGWLRWQWPKRVFLVVLAVGLGWMFTHVSTRQYWVDETSNQLAAVEWVRKHVPQDAVIATDNYLYPYLAQEAGYRNVSYFFSTEYDPEIRKTYNDDWRDIQYLVLTHEVVKQIKSGTVPRMKALLDHSVLLADYRDQTSSYIDLPNYISTNGDWAQVYKVKSRNDIVLHDTWQYFKGTYVIDYGQVVDITNDSLSTSGSQAQAMLRAVSQNDQAMFGGLWQWSKDHLRYRQDDKLLSWKWALDPITGEYTLGDTNTVCEADQSIAYALFLADEAWPGNGYGEEALVHIRDWWRKCTFERNGKRYLDSSADGSQDVKLINTGYFNPAMYRYLAVKTPDLPWGALINDGYELLARVHRHFGTIPDWVLINLDGSLTSASNLVANADSFSYDALRLIPNIVVDYTTNGEARALELLGWLNQPVANFASATNSLPSRVAQLLLMQVLATSDRHRAAAGQLYDMAIFSQYNANEGSWGDGTNYLDHVWLWQWHALQHDLPQIQQINLR